MKNILFTFLLVLLAFSIKAQNEESFQKDIITSHLERGFFIEKQMDLYTFLPTSLSFWNHSDWSSISFNGNQTTGQFKTKDQFKTIKGFSFKTESIQSFNKQGLKFYGNFTYKTSKHEEADLNLFFEKSKIGSPFRVIAKPKSFFNCKQYGLEGIMTKNLGNKLQIGAHIKYTGDMYFRIRDPRNEQYKLSVSIKSSLNYQISETQNISAGIGYIKKKSEPAFRNEYHSTTDEYTINLTTDFEKIAEVFTSSEFVITDMNPSFLLGYNVINKNSFSVNYSYYSGSELWEKKIGSLGSATDRKQFEYKYNKHNALASYLINNANYHLLNKLDIEFISGQSYSTSINYGSTIYDGLKLNGTIDLLRNNRKLFDQTGIELGFENVSKKDLKNGHLMEYSNLNINFKTGFNTSFSKLNTVRIEAEGGYKINLSYVHNTASVPDAFYTKDIAHNEMAFHTADYYTLGGKLTWFHQFKKSATEVVLNFQQLTPTDIKIQNQYSILEKSTNRTHIGLSFNLIF